MRVSRRSMLKLGALGLAATTLEVVGGTAWLPKRAFRAAPSGLPSVQFDLEQYIAPAETIDGLQFRFGPVFTSFLTARLSRRPAVGDQRALREALETIEGEYAFEPKGVFTFIAYGLPYFRRLPRGLVSEHMPRLRSDTSRFALEEAVPSPTDVAPGNRPLDRKRFRMPVSIEDNDLLITLRSDSLTNLLDVGNWLTGGDWLRDRFVPKPALNGLLEFTSARLMFAQRGLPRKVADAHNLPYAGRIHPDSPMWMGFADQHVTGAGPASIVTFQGNEDARFTDTTEGDYFFDGSIQHLSHLVLDLAEWYDESYLERVQYMFRSNPAPSAGNEDQYTDGGGPAFLEAKFQGKGDALKNARASIRSRASGGWATWRRCTARPAQWRGRRFTSGWTVRASTAWMCRTGVTSRSSNSRSWCPLRTSSRQCGAIRRRSILCGNTTWRRRTTVSSAS